MYCKHNQSHGKDAQPDTFIAFRAAKLQGSIVRPSETKTRTSMYSWERKESRNSRRSPGATSPSFHYSCGDCRGRRSQCEAPTVGKVFVSSRTKGFGGVDPITIPESVLSKHCGHQIRIAVLLGVAPEYCPPHSSRCIGRTRSETARISHNLLTE